MPVQTLRRYPTPITLRRYPQNASFVAMPQQSRNFLEYVEE
jgi:hypothetical protein